MNLLAHIYLSGNDQQLMIGNFIADGIRGKQGELLPEGIKKGIALHHKIDHFTDTHPVVKKSVDRLRINNGKYSPVISDVFFDHFLAANWRKYSHIPLDTFADLQYEILLDHSFYFPWRVKHMMSYMIKQNWLVNYAYIEGIERTLNGLSERTRFISNLGRAITDLRTDYALYRQDFEQFFPELEEYVQKEIKRTNHGINEL